MWRRTEESKPRETGGPSVISSPKQAGTAGEGPSKAPNTPAAVSKDIKIRGDITGQGDLSIDGQLEGNVDLRNGTFIVGPNARVTGEIEAREVVIRGEVIGALKSCEHVHIGSTGRLTGDMETRGIVIEDGAILHSRVAVPKVDEQEVATHPSPGEADQANQPALQKARASGA